eukprot:GHVU01207973.1.p1 GENE.GHVU01207973.1~~GHVU01207973.1.p1  ORF type:complete len:124 (+),score=45.01 GHVU01207973.1:26-373(+)
MAKKVQDARDVRVGNHPGASKHVIAEDTGNAVNEFIASRPEASDDFQMRTGRRNGAVAFPVPIPGQEEEEEEEEEKEEEDGKGGGRGQKRRKRGNEEQEGKEGGRGESMRKKAKA